MAAERMTLPICSEAFTLQAFTQVRDLLLGSRLSCVERVSEAWRSLEHLSATDFPAALSADWPAVAGRASRIASAAREPVASAEPHEGEAAQIASVLLLTEFLLRREFIRERQN